MIYKIDCESKLKRTKTPPFIFPNELTFGKVRIVLLFVKNFEKRNYVPDKLAFCPNVKITFNLMADQIFCRC